MPFDIDRLKTYPDRPGVYLMKDVKGAILYIGKAKNLKQRIRQYFTPGRDDRIQIPFLIAAVEDIETIIVSSEKDALLLEARLIRRLKPKYNILLKDDRSQLLIRIGMEHEWPRIEYVRSKNAHNLAPQAFGPFSRPRDMFELAVRLFQIRQCSDEEFKRRKTPCILYQMKRCSAPCIQEVDREEYLKAIQQAKDFFEGKISWVRERLHLEMEKASEELEFERAAVLLQKIQILDQIASQKGGDRIEGISDCDVVGLWREGTQGLAIALMHYRQGILRYSEGWAFFETELIDKPQEEIGDLVASLIVQLYQRRGKEWKGVVGDESKIGEILLPKECSANTHIMGEALSDIFSRKVIAKCPTIGPKAKIVRLAVENAKARLWQRVHAKEFTEALLSEIATELNLNKIPRCIDCFDASHFGGKDKVATCVSFEDGEPNKKRYRTFIMQGSETADDPELLKEAILRRYKDGSLNEIQLPDLIVVDGGRQQLHMACAALQMLGIVGVDVISLVKESGRHDKGLTKERIYISDRKEPLSLSPRSPSLQLLQRIRDEAHRFSLEFQKKRRSKSTLKSRLNGIPGIGPKKRHKVLQAFHGVQSIQKATKEEIAEKSGLSQSDAERIKQSLSETDPLG